MKSNLHEVLTGIEFLDQFGRRAKLMYFYEDKHGEICFSYQLPDDKDRSGQPCGGSGNLKEFIKLHE